MKKAGPYSRVVQYCSDEGIELAIRRVFADVPRPLNSHVSLAVTQLKVVHCVSPFFLMQWLTPLEFSCLLNSHVSLAVTQQKVVHCVSPFFLMQWLTPLEFSCLLNSHVSLAVTQQKVVHCVSLSLLKLLIPLNFSCQNIRIFTKASPRHGIGEA